jgi:hypothetical protein
MALLALLAYGVGAFAVCNFWGANFGKIFLLVTATLWYVLYV